MSDARDQFTKVAVVFLLAGAIGFGVLEGNSGGAKIPKGKPAPAFKVEKLTGGTASPGDYAGKVVMVAFWGTWCPPCKEELPHLVDLADEYQAKGATLLAINDVSEDRENMPAFVEKELPKLKPYAAWGNEEVFRNYEVEVMPSLYVLNGAGQVVGEWHGYTGPAQVRAVKANVDRALKR